MFYNDNQVIFWILAIIFGSTTIGGLFKQCRVLIGGWLFNIFFVCRNKKIDEYNEAINQCSNEIKDIQEKIELKIK